jgi:hypothetical protein
VRRLATGQRRLEAVLFVAVDEVVIVVAGEEDEALAGKTVGKQRQQAEASTASPTEPKRKSKRSPSRITSSIPSRAGASRPRKNSSRRRSRPVQAPKCVSEMTNARKARESRRGF